MYVESITSQLISFQFIEIVYLIWFHTRPHGRPASFVGEETSNGRTPTNFGAYSATNKTAHDSTN